MRATQANKQGLPKPVFLAPRPFGFGTVHWHTNGGLASVLLPRAPQGLAGWHPPGKEP